MGCAARCLPGGGSLFRAAFLRTTRAPQRTWLSSDLRRVQGRVPVDDVMAGAADHQGLAPHPCHFRRPGGLARAGFPEAGEFADLVHKHRARFRAQLAPPRQEPVRPVPCGGGGLAPC